MQYMGVTGSIFMLGKIQFKVWLEPPLRKFFIYIELIKGETNLPSSSLLILNLWIVLQFMKETEEVSLLDLRISLTSVV